MTSLYRKWYADLKWSSEREDGLGVSIMLLVGLALLVASPILLPLSLMADLVIRWFDD